MLKQREEDFCKAIVRGMSPTEAATIAGWAPSSAHSLSGKILKRPAVVARIEQLRAISAYRLHYTVSRLIEEIEMVQQRAAAGQEWSVVLKAIDQKATLLGLKPKEAGDVNVNVVYMPLAEPTKQLSMSADDWAAKWSPKQITNGHGNGHA